MQSMKTRHGIATVNYCTGDKVLVVVEGMSCKVKPKYFVIVQAYTIGTLRKHHESLTEIMSIRKLMLYNEIDPMNRV